MENGDYAFFLDGLGSSSPSTLVLGGVGIKISRRTALTLVAASSVLHLTKTANAVSDSTVPKAMAATKTFGYDDVVSQARALSERAFEKNVSEIPKELSSLSYDQYREIRFRREKAFWQSSNSDFRLHLFHPGSTHDKPVQIHLIKDALVLPLPFTTSYFECGKNAAPPKLPISLGFAGFAITTTLNSLKVQDEVISFLGSSYFRFLGAAILFPPSLGRLYIAVDADPAGRHGMERLSRRARQAGIEVLTLSPRLGDFNEDLRRLGPAALAGGLRDQLVPQDVARFLPSV